MSENRTIVPGEIEGFLSGCPFCTSYRIGIPEIGTRFRIISGSTTGATGTVVEWPKNCPEIQNEFIAQMDHDPPEWQTRVSIKREMIEKLPSLPVPEWAPPLCLGDASELDKAVVKFCEESFNQGEWKVDWDSFNEVVRKVWNLRLPLEPNELWDVLNAHGVPERSKRELIEFYEKGRKLLIYSVGRRPIKKKRVKPLST
jgi:hypothetical protein